MKPSQSDLRDAVVDFFWDRYSVIGIRRALASWGWDVTVSDIKPIVIKCRMMRKRLAREEKEWRKNGERHG